MTALRQRQATQQRAAASNTATTDMTATSGHIDNNDSDEQW